MMPPEQRDLLIKKATAFVEESQLSPSEKKLLEGRIPLTPPAVLTMFVQVCEEDPFAINAVLKSLQKKLETQGNLVRLHEIIRQERREVEDALVSG